MAKAKKSAHNMTLLDHLIELRNRLLISFCAFLFLFFLCFIKFTDNNQNLADIVYKFLQAPLASEILENGGRMIYTALHEGFFTQVKVAFFISICVSLPIFLIQIWRFVAPGLYKNEKKAFLPFLLATPVLFVAGAAMVYYIVIPLAWDFFLSFQVRFLSSIVFLVIIFHAFIGLWTVGTDYLTKRTLGFLNVSLSRRADILRYIYYLIFGFLGIVYLTAILYIIWL